jgi:hypothetical protein
MPKGSSLTMSQSEIKQRIDDSQTIVSTWEELHTAFGRTRDTAWIFRGVSSPKHYPIPSIGREAVYGPYKLAQEERLLQEFKYRAVSLVRAPEFNDWHWLAYAQHLGVPTRLLDWTTSPLIAAFFALQDDCPSDRAIYCVKYSRFLYEVESNAISPFACTAEGRFTPPLIFDRLRAQRGLFTIHPRPTSMFYQSGMKVIRIPRDLVDKFRRRLFKYGVDYWSIYPDAEGLGQQLRWYYKNKVGLGSIFVGK